MLRPPKNIGRQMSKRQTVKLRKQLDGTWNLTREVVDKLSKLPEILGLPGGTS